MNPAPYVRGVVERGSRIFVVMERLSPYDNPHSKPSQTTSTFSSRSSRFVWQVYPCISCPDILPKIRVDLFARNLISPNCSFQDPCCYMVDLSSAPSSCLSSTDFDRTRYPVKYYFTDLSLATKFDIPSSPGATSLESEFRATSRMRLEYRSVADSCKLCYALGQGR